jgi:hypothetical protein
METQGEIFFYKGEIEKIVDVYLCPTDKDVEVYFYPHNGASFILNTKEFFEKREEELKSFIRKLSAEDPHTRKSWTINYETMTAVTEKDFSLFSVLSNDEKGGSFVAFIFDVDDFEKGFPTIYVKIKSFSSSDDGVIFPLQVYSSHNIANPLNIQTNMGKAFTSSLIYSTLCGRFQSRPPAISSVLFPSNHRLNRISSAYKTEALMKLAESIGDLGRKEEDSPPLLPTSILYLDGKDRPAENSLIRQIVDKNAIPLSEILIFGVKETIELIVDKTRIVNILVDISGVLKKACIMEGFVYGIPENESFDWSAITGEDEDLFVFCTEESFPT